jgi:hypothetical protein
MLAGLTVKIFRVRNVSRNQLAVDHELMSHLSLEIFDLPNLFQKLKLAIALELLLGREELLPFPASFGVILRLGYGIRAKADTFVFGWIFDFRRSRW